MKFIYITVVVLCCQLLPLEAISQVMLRGVVRDQKEPLIGATVYLANNENRVIKGVVTNENGEYFLELTENAKGMNIVYSFIGYKTKTVKYTGQKVQNVTLEDESTTLDAVTVQAKAIERNSMGVATKDLGVARQKIELEEFQDMPVTSVEDMLQGKMANVDIIASSGDPGSRASIRIRGTSSLNASNEPLIVIDGIAYDTDIDEDFQFSTATDEDFGALVNIAPSDIAAIEVLKDAAATAIWGSKAANGVLLITTKRGEKGKPRFSISQKINLNIEPKTIPMLNAQQYVTLMQDALWNKVNYRGFPQTGETMAFLSQYKDIRYDPAYKYFNEFTQETDWLDLITQNALNSETNFFMSGGGDRATYRFSAGYLTEKGTTIGTSFKRLTTRLNVDYNFSKKLRVSSSFSYAEGRKAGSYSSGNTSNVRNYARTKMPNMSPWVLDEDGNPTDEYFTNPTDAGNECIQGTWANGGEYNPVALVHQSTDNTTNRDMRVQFSLIYDIISGLRFSGDIGFDLGSSKRKSFLPSSVTGVAWTHADYNLGTDNMSDKMKIATNLKLIYTKAFAEKHKIVLTGMAQTNDYSSTNYNSSVSGIGSVEVADPAAGGKITKLTSSSSSNRSVGFLANGHYNYDDRYMITAAIRYDGNSKMGRNSRWGTFPSLSGAWRVSREVFLRDIEWIEEIKLRASWGKSGTSPSGNYSYVGTFGSDGKFMDFDVITPNSVQLNNLKWETVSQQNYGLDVNLFKNKLSVVLEYYKKTTDDVLQTNVPIQSTAGFSKIGYFNSGKIENRGWEIMVDLRDIICIGNLKIGFTNINLSRNRNRVLEMPSNILDENYTDPKNGTYAQNVIVGNPMGSFYGYRCLGVYQNVGETVARDANGNVIYNIYKDPVVTTINGKEVRPGHAKYEDVNHDGVIDKYDMVYLGNSMPVLTGGATLNMSYGAFKFRMSFHTRIGQSVVNKARMDSESMYNANNQSTAVLNRWRYEGDDTDIPMALYGEAYNYLGSDRFVEKATFVRMKDMMLSYTLPKRILQKLKLNKLSCYVTGYDLFTWSKYKGQDPEVGLGSSKGIYQLAQDKSTTPKPRRFAIGVTIDF